MNRTLALTFILTSILTFAVYEGQAHCNEFGHSCRGGHGKRSVPEQEQLKEQINPNALVEDYPNEESVTEKRVENNRIMQIVPVTVYYESLCPDSAEFINKQVYPALKDNLKDYVDITWIPYGKSTYTTQGADVEFQCHHGPNECYGNKVHACAIEHIQASSYQTELTRESLILEFINCMMKAGKNFPDNVYPGSRCARENNIYVWDSIQTCANSTEGSQLLKKYGEATNNFMKPLKSVPTITFREQYSDDFQEMAVENFHQTLCAKIPEPRPTNCQIHDDAVGITAIPFLCVYLYGLLRLFV